MQGIRNYSAFGISLGIHAVILAAMAMIQLELNRQEDELAIETVMEEDRVQEEYSQELEEAVETTDQVSYVTGGTVSTTVGAATGPTVQQTKIETSETLQEPEVQVNPGDITVPGDELLGEDLGESEVSGEVGAAVKGYGQAMDRITKELIRLMREKKVLVTWLFDESKSLEDDRQEISEKFKQVYEELGVARKQENIDVREGREILLTSVASYGKSLNFITPEPTADTETIRKAIRQVPIDESGKENMCQSIAAVVDKFGRRARSTQRKLVIIVVSDEAGDDGPVVEKTIEKAKQVDAPVYIMGREAVFGYPYARMRWKDPKYGLWHWVDIRRGPETAFPEQLQWDGLRRRHDSFSSGFGPYEQVRIAKETGGIFFILPGEEEKLTGAGAHEKRKFDFLDMKEYQPMLLPRRVYAQARDRSEFRKTIWQVIVRLNPNENELLPNHDPKLNIREHWYPLRPAEFRKEGQEQVARAARAMELLNQALPMLKRIEPLRAKEPYQRWRANYDLIKAQCIAYRVRLFQFLLAMDQHAANMPAPKKEKTNRWNVRRTRKMLKPDQSQFERIKKAFGVKASLEEYNQMIDRQQQTARELFKVVIEEHPGTPWARRAKRELNQGFGMTFVEAYRNPNYDRKDIEVPNF